MPKGRHISDSLDPPHTGGMHNSSATESQTSNGAQPHKPESGVTEHLAGVRNTVPSEAGASGPGKEQRGFATVLRNRYFLRLWIAQLISQTIMNAANYGVIILLDRQSHGSSLATSGAVVAFSLPAIFFGAPAGVLVDRLDRRLVLWLSNMLRALASLLFVGSLIVFPNAILPVFVLTFFIAAIGQFFSPAEGASIPLLVHPEELINALALFNITFTMAQAVGLVLLGPIILLLLPQFVIGSAAHHIVIDPIVSLFIIVALLYVVCAVLILSIPHARLRIAPHPREPRRALLREEEQQIASIWHGIVECWHFIRKDLRLLVSVLQLTLGGVIIAVIAIIAPRFVTDFFHEPAKLSALVFIPAGAGLVLGSILTPRVRKRFPYITVVTGGIIGLAVSTALLTLVRVLAPVFHPHQWWLSWTYLTIMIFLTFCMGIALDFINVPAQTLMQERSPDWIKGRVLAVQTILLNAVTVIFVPVVGIVADHLGLPAALDILAIFVAAAGLASVYYLVRGQRRASK